MNNIKSYINNINTENNESINFWKNILDIIKLNLINKNNKIKYGKN